MIVAEDRLVAIERTLGRIHDVLCTIAQQLATPPVVKTTPVLTKGKAGKCGRCGALESDWIEANGFGTVHRICGRCGATV